MAVYIHGRCGDGTLIDIFIPKPIPFFRDKVVDTIKCGFFHTYVKTVDGEHYLFGTNKNSECITSNEQYVSLPFYINEVVRKKCKGKEVLDAK